MMKFEIGETVKDVFTGFTGVIMARTEYSSGCNHYALQTKKLNKDGKIQDYEWLDETRLEHLDVKKIVVNEKGKYASGPFQNAPNL